MSSRTYLSIGDVLGLLRQEFPDVTISKIRFLESQGLVNPERTPSGYRKFYEHDVERLRWVLRQQREHFLPLKVIKGRLEQDGPDDVDAGLAAQVSDEDVAHAVAGPVERSRRVLATRGAPAHADAGASHEAAPRTGADVSMGPAGRVTVPTAGREPTGREPTGREPTGREPTEREPTEREPTGRGPTGRVPVGGEAVARERAERAPVGVGTRAAPGAHVPAPAAPGAHGAASSPRGAPPAARRVVGASPQSATTPDPAPAHRADAADAAAVETLSGDAMTAEELASAAGLDAAAVAQLESYGLVSGRVVGGVTYYERDALEVARLAAGFARYGVEARHLRLHKHAAEREAGFIEQIVLPVLKQRNPEARRRALDTVGELSRLGLGLREVLLRSTLRDQLGG